MKKQKQIKTLKEKSKKSQHMKTAHIPMKTIGPLKIRGLQNQSEEVFVPLATFETPLWPSTERGARISRMTDDGIHTTLFQDGMTRSILLEAESSDQLKIVLDELPKKMEALQAEVAQTSHFAKLLEFQPEIVGKLLYLRLVFKTGDAAGHNMATKASDAIMKFLLSEYIFLKYVSISANICTDKKVSAINGILGRGKYVTAEIKISREICEKMLRATPEQIVELNIKKNLIGSTLAGSLRSSNAHFANILLAFYLATGQDAANIVEGSQGLTQAETCKEGLYFSVTLPNLILGTIGNGKNLDFVHENLEKMGCLPTQTPGESAQRLAKICAASVLCSELSLLAAQANPGELVRSHVKLER